MKPGFFCFLAGPIIAANILKKAFATRSNGEKSESELRLILRKSPTH
ncbi:hypothetical protein GEOBC_02270 [Geobacteraceae bacterium]|nr:hypothetical protein GEOBC_02270 [Geobacteraceae bacterium]